MYHWFPQTVLSTTVVNKTFILKMSAGVPARRPAALPAASSPLLKLGTLLLLETGLNVGEFSRSLGADRIGAIT